MASSPYFNPTIGINAYNPGMAPPDVMAQGYYGYNDPRDQGGNWSAQPQQQPAPQPAQQPYGGNQGGFGNVGNGSGAGPGGGYNSSGTQNPYLSGAEAGITRRMTDNLQRNILPQISQGAMAAGGYGGSRQGVLEANAMRDMNLGLGDTLAAMNSGDWNQEQGRDLSRYGMDQGFYASQRGQDLASVGLGADLYSKGMEGQWKPLQNAGQIYNPLTGLGTTTQNQSSGGGWQGATGGAISAYDFYRNMTK